MLALLLIAIKHTAGNFIHKMGMGVKAMTQSMKPNAAVGGPGETTNAQDVRIAPLGLAGILTIPSGATALVIFAHGSGSSRLSPRNQTVARALNGRGIATLLLDLLTSEEEGDRANVFDIRLLASRLIETVDWLDKQPETHALRIGLFGASTGAAAALVTAAELGGRIGAIVSRGGRPDLARNALDRILTPTLLIVGGADFIVIELNEQAFERLHGPKALEIVPEATHLFPEPGALEMVIERALAWFKTYLEPGPLPANRTDPA